VNNSHPAFSRPTAREAYVYAGTIFLSSFLLFQVQPIIAKIILPWFGGSSAVWSTCMVFFQIALLLGYLYAHWLHDVRNGRMQAIVHIVLLGLGLLALPIIPNASWKPAGADASPSLRILGLLAVTIGLPYLTLSSTSPLLQSWYSRRHKGIPYRLFALSNVASMLALLSYPVLVEPNLSTRFQAQTWSVGYALFALACAFTAWHASSAPVLVHAETSMEEDTGPAPDWATRLLWLGLSACGSILLLGVTTFLTQDVASIPFLWIVPLAVYLLTFIICFDSPRWYNRAVFYPLLGVGLAMLGGFQRALNIPDRMTITIGVSALSLFVCCMVCHGEMVRLKPPSRYLTGFYLMVAAGGAAGGLFVGLLAPNLFNANYEFPIGLCVTAILATYVLLRNRGGWLRRGGLGEATGIAIVLLVVAYVSYVGTKTVDTVRGYRAVARNFYGLLRVIDVGQPVEDDAYRELLHGRIDHGIQMLSAKYHKSPVEYFCPASGIGQALSHRPAGVPWRIGIVGLGTGTLAAYGRPGDSIRIYEINPVVVKLAHSQFSYLDDSAAKIEVALGDGRLSLESEPDQKFDLLVIDVFSGDSVPVHVLTVEAFKTYFRHLKPGGILSVNITNRYLNLEPVMETASRAYGREAVVFDYDAKPSEFLCTSSSWVLIVDKNSPVLNGLQGQRLITARAGFRTWTDDYSNMFRILR